VGITGDSRECFVCEGRGGGGLLYLVVVFDLSSECTIEVWAADAAR
jgi:hypothetical protein